ncbi:UNVERIFIED_CONTAM: hypothetical protein FKN15_023318 [Acipenser sinensis]
MRNNMSAPISGTVRSASYVIRTACTGARRGARQFKLMLERRLVVLNGRLSPSKSPLMGNNSATNRGLIPMSSTESLDETLISALALFGA